jgi:hypothetical protein
LGKKSPKFRYHYIGGKKQKKKNRGARSRGTLVVNMVVKKKGQNSKKGKKIKFIVPNQPIGEQSPLSTLFPSNPIFLFLLDSFQQQHP